MSELPTEPAVEELEDDEVFEVDAEEDGETGHETSED